MKTNANGNSSQAKAKYSNQTQLVQGVSQVNDPTLTQGERLFLNCLAAFTVHDHPHPGNAQLIRACGIRSRQGVNKIARKLEAKKLIQILERGDGRGKATVYRICVEHPAFPWPRKKADKPGSPDFPFRGQEPATPELSVSADKPETPELSVSDRKPATGDRETRNCEHQNPQLSAQKPATLELHTDLNHEYKTRITSTGESLRSPRQQLPRWKQLEELGLSKAGNQTTGDQYARLIRRLETQPGFPEDGNHLPAGAYNQLEVLLLQRGTRFDSDPDVLALVGSINQRWAAALAQQSAEQSAQHEIQRAEREAQAKAEAEKRARDDEERRRKDLWGAAQRNWRYPQWTKEEFEQEYARLRHHPTDKLFVYFGERERKMPPQTENVARCEVSLRAN